MERIEPGNPFWASEVSRPHNICLMKVSHLFCCKVRIRLFIVVSLGLDTTSLPLTGEDLGNCRDTWYSSNRSLFKLPIDNFCPDARKCRTTSLVRLQFSSNRKYFLNHRSGCFSPYSLWCSTSVCESFGTFLFMPLKPFGKPIPAPLYKVVLLCDAFHILSDSSIAYPLPKSFWKKFRLFYE